MKPTPRALNFPLLLIMTQVSKNMKKFPAKIILEWIQKREQEFRQEYSKKEAELKLHIANNIKPSIQVSQTEFYAL